MDILILVLGTFLSGLGVFQLLGLALTGLQYLGGYLWDLLG